REKFSGVEDHGGGAVMVGDDGGSGLKKVKKLDRMVIELKLDKDDSVANLDHINITHGVRRELHKVFGASNFSKLLLHIPVHKRLDAVVTVCYEAQARIRDPVYGCVAHLFALQQQVANLQAELSYFRSHLATLEVQPPPPPPQVPPSTAAFSVADLPITTPSLPAIYDLSVLFDPMIQSSAWSMQQSSRLVDPDHQFTNPATSTPPQHEGGGGTGDLHELARELLQRQSTGSSEASTLPPHT
nr:LOB domain-containing protein 18 [Tanacetum cinerariifolium]